MTLKKATILTLICIVSVLTSLKSSAQVPTNGLVAYYPFTIDTKNHVSNTLHATANGASPSIGRSSFNNCYKFNGTNDRIDIPSSFDFLPRTVNLWFNAEDADYSDWRFIYESDNATLQSGLLELVLKDIDGKLSLFINAGNCRDTVEINKNEWYNVNLFVDPTKIMKVHVNGTLETNKTFTTFSKSASGVNSVVIGADRSQNARFFKGSIDDIAIFNRELTETEINAIVNSASDSLVAYYPFNGNVRDSSGNGFHGTQLNTISSPDKFNHPSSSLKFNGTSYVEFPSNFDFVPRTVNLWFKAEQDNYTDWKFIYESDNPELQNGLLELVLKEENGQLKLYINAGNCRDTADVQIDTWYNVNLFVDSNKVMKFYLNGKLVTTKTFTTNLTSGSGLNNVILGTNRLKTGGFFKGQIDEVKFYSYELSAAEIKDNFSLSSPVTFKTTLKIYPNPTKEKINIDCGSQYQTIQNASLRITNSLG